MAIFYDNFQSYGVGYNGPWGALNALPGSSIATISNTADLDGSQGPIGQTKYLNCVLGGGYFNDGVYRSSGSVFCYIRRQGDLSGVPFAGRPIEFWNGTSIGAGPGLRLFWLEFNADGTLSPHGVILFGSAVLGPPSNFVFADGQWNFMQTNITFSNVGGNVAYTYNVLIDGNSVMSGSYTSNFPVASLVGGYWDETLIQAGAMTTQFGEVTIDTLQAAPTFPNPGTPTNRITNQVIELILGAGSAPLLVACPPGTGHVGVPYVGSASASGGTGPYTYSITLGVLPTGLTLNGGTGAVTGTPTTNGTFPYTIKVTDSLGATNSSNCQIVITTAAIPTVVCPTGTATLGSAYSSTATASGGTAPYTWSIPVGALPTGITLNPANGLVSGTPSVAGVFIFTMKVTDANGLTDSHSCQIIVARIFPPPVPISGNTCTERDTPILYGWEPSYLERPEDIAMRASDWEDAGLVGAKFLQGFTLQADTDGQNKSLTIQGDGATIQTFVINHNGEQIKPYVFNPTTIASLMRFISPDSVPWRFFGIRYIWEPVPELVTFYQTQGTTHDIPGYQFLKDGYISLISTAVVTLTITVDGVNYNYNIPSTGGLHQKFYLIFGINNSTGRTLKGKEYQYTLSSSAGFRLFQKDCEVRVHPWNGGDYMVKQPFGDTSRIYGARI